MAVLTDGVKGTLKSAARKLGGFRRRQFQAEVAKEYCQGSARRAESVFSWGRQAVATGLNELRTGIRCLEDYAKHGRPRTEEKYPELKDEIHAMVESTSQADPKFQTPLAFTRMTAKAVQEQLANNGVRVNRPTPSERTVRDILERMGYRLRRVRKVIPKKKPRKPTRSSRT